jgi:hypothetical protein
MSLRRPNLGAALLDLAPAVGAFALGAAGAGLDYFALVFLAGVALWAWTRRNVVARLHGVNRIANIALALSVLAIVLGGAYWLGLSFRGRP